MTPRPAYMSTPAVKSPTPSFYLSFFLCPPFSCSTAPQAFSRPDRVLSQAGARRCCQGWPLLQRPPPSGGPWPLQQSSTTAGLMGRGRLHSCLLFICLECPAVSAHYSDNGCCFLAGLATKSMARAIIASTYIRQLRSGLPRCCLHGRSRRRDGAHL